MMLSPDNPETPYDDAEQSAAYAMMAETLVEYATATGPGPEPRPERDCLPFPGPGNSYRLFDTLTGEWLGECTP